MNLIYFFFSNNQDPHFYLALEKCLLDSLPADTMIFWIWKSQPAVVLGKNQVLWNEVNVPYCMEHNILIARRISGGGTVYHDPGNVNYSFIIPKNKYRESDILKLTVAALNDLGIDAKINQKNALFVDQYKIGGTAFRIGRTHVLHHGTLLLNANLTHLKNSLSAELKCDTRAIPSRPAEVVNLKDIYQQISEEDVFHSLLDHLKSYFKCEAKARNYENLVNPGQLKADIKKMKSYEWIAGESPEFSLNLSDDHSDGVRKIKLTIRRGKIYKLEYFTSSETAPVEHMKKELPGTPMTKNHLKTEVFGDLKLFSKNLAQQLMDLAL